MKMSPTDIVLAAHEAQLSTPLRLRGLNPETHCLPLTVEEAWVLVMLDLVDTPQGSLMCWQAESDCDEDHSDTEGECLHWSAAYEADNYISIEDLRAEAPCEWSPAGPINGSVTRAFTGTVKAMQHIEVLRNASEEE